MDSKPKPDPGMLAAVRHEQEHPEKYGIEGRPGYFHCSAAISAAVQAAIGDRYTVDPCPWCALGIPEERIRAPLTSPVGDIGPVEMPGRVGAHLQLLINAGREAERDGW